MGYKERFVVVNTDVLPEIIMKVLDTKKMIARGDAKSSTEACKIVGISRSAYYKYKESVFAYDERLTNRIITLYFVLRDEAGVLSSILSKLYELQTNILTVNQNIPVDDVASVTVSIRLDGEDVDISDIRKELSDLSGVVDVKIISGV